MDEPFGALDPITRTRLQDEFLAILKRLRKTIVLVTHDLDEAIRMGNQVAVMRQGRIEQCDTPLALLARPANDFVRSFVGEDRALRRLALLSVADSVEAIAVAHGAPTVLASANLRDALAQLLAAGADVARVVDAQGTTVGGLSLSRLLASGRLADPDPAPPAAHNS